MARGRETLIFREVGSIFALGLDTFIYIRNYNISVIFFITYLLYRVTNERSGFRKSKRILHGKYGSTASKNSGEQGWEIKRGAWSEMDEEKRQLP